MLDNSILHQYHNFYIPGSQAYMASQVEPEDGNLAVVVRSDDNFFFTLERYYKKQ